MQNNLLPYLEKIAKTYKIQSQPQPELLETYEWITKYCSYEFNDEGDLICTNSLGKTFIINKSRSSVFGNSGHLYGSNNEKIMRLFSKSQFNFKFGCSNHITIQMHDCLLEVCYINCFGTNKGMNAVSYVIKPTDTCYEIEFLINNGCNICLSINEVSELLITEPKKYLTEIIMDRNFDDLFKKITNFSSENVVVNFNKFKITTAIKPEINKFIISELCLNAKHADVVKFLKESIEYKILHDLDKEIYSKTLRLIDLVKKREATKISQDKFILFSKIKPKYDKCMTEIININFDQQLANIRNVPLSLRKFTKVWSFDNIDDFQKQFDLEDSELELANYLYKLDNTTRTQKLLENNIFA